MPSPFPGMDPYLERSGDWSELHLNLITAMQNELNRALPDRYVARADRHVWIAPVAGEDRPTLRLPDVFLMKRPKGKRTAPASSSVIVAAPRTVLVPRTERRGSPFLQIEDVESKRVVTVIELLSPSNKAPGRDREGYLAKRTEYLDSKVNFVEMDFLRSGERVLVGEAIPEQDYYILVCPLADLPKAGLWMFSVRVSLPIVPIPLDEGEKGVMLNVQNCFKNAYHNARFDKLINYDRPPVPPLRPADAAWAKTLLAKRKRSS